MSRGKLIIPLIAVVALSMLAMTLLLVGKIERQKREELSNSLQTILKTTHGAVEVWARGLEDDLRSISDSYFIKNNIEAQLARFKTHQALADARLRNELNKMLRPWLKAQGYLDYALLATDGTEISGFEKGLGLQHLVEQRGLAIQKALGGQMSIGMPFILDQPVMIVARPIRDESQNILGVLVFYMSPLRIFNRMTQLGRMGKTGETYAVDHQGRMVTESRFASQLKEIDFVPSDVENWPLVELRDPGGNIAEGFVPHQARSSMPFTKAARSLMKGESGINIEGYRDYRGVPVVGAWMWLDDLGFGLITEMDKAEAYSSWFMIKNLMWICIITTMLGSLAILLLWELRSRSVRVNQSLRQIGHARQQVIAMLAHDLKNPLNVIHMSNEFLNDNLPSGSVGEVLREDVMNIRRAENQMNKLITDLLECAKLEEGNLRLQLQRCEIGPLMNSIRDLYGPLTHEKRIEIFFEIPDYLPPILADSDRLNQVFSNLIGNAIKFTPSRGKIHVRAADASTHIKFSVADSGRGINPEDIGHVFDRFWQSPKAKRLGTGLGLFICRELITAHGGKIWVESQVGRGSTFHFSVPKFI